MRTYFLNKLVSDVIPDDEKLDPGYLVEQKLSARLNVIFDVDHTLILALERNMTRLKPGEYKNTHLLKLNGGHEFCLVVREGV